MVLSQKNVSYENMREPVGLPIDMMNSVVGLEKRSYISGPHRG